jgi:hypothetical protein
MRARRRALLACVPICLSAAVVVGAIAHRAIDAHSEPEHSISADTIVIAPSVTPSSPAAPASEREQVAPPADPAPPTDAPALTSPQVDPATPEPAAAVALPPSPPPVLRDNQIIVYYGTPLAEGLGVLGTLRPEDAALQVAERARVYDSLNGDLGAVGALDVIYSLAQAEPTSNGLYIRHLEDHYVERYLRIAEEHNLQVFLDLQIGRAQILDEVRNIERFLLNPRVHVAIDPEYAVGPEGVPIATPGRISGDDINTVQAYLRELVTRHGLPGKILVVHQYMDDTVVDAERVEAVNDVDFVLNMDGLGDVNEKKEKYQHFSSKPHSKHDAFNVFLIHDHYVMGEEEIVDLTPMPRIVFYQ